MAIYDNFTNEITYEKKDGNYDINYEVIEESYTDVIDIAMFISAHCTEVGTPDIVEYFVKDNKYDTEPSNKNKSDGKFKNVIKFLMFVKKSFQAILEDDDSITDIEEAYDEVETQFKKDNKNINLIEEYGEFYSVIMTNLLYAFVDVITKNDKDEKGEIIDIIDFKKTKYDNFDEKDYLDFILNFINNSMFKDYYNFILNSVKK